MGQPLTRTPRPKQPISATFYKEDRIIDIHQDDLEPGGVMRLMHNRIDTYVHSLAHIMRPTRDWDRVVFQDDLGHQVEGVA